MTDNKNHSALDVAGLIGAGFGDSMRCTGSERRLSRSSVEAGGSIGGTWYWNRYPERDATSRDMQYLVLVFRRDSARMEVVAALLRRSLKS